MCAPLLGASWEEQKQLQTAKGRVVPGGSGASQHHVGKEELQQCCCQDAGNWLPTIREPSHCSPVLPFLIRSSISGQDCTHGARNVTAEWFCQKLLVCQNQHTSWRFVSSDTVVWNGNEKTLKKSGNLIQFFNMECFNFSVSK